MGQVEAASSNSQSLDLVLNVEHMASLEPSRASLAWTRRVQESTVGCHFPARPMGSAE